MQPQDRDVRQILQPFIRRWWVIAVVAGAIGVATYYYYSHQRPSYAATTTVFVRSAGTGPVVGLDPETDPDRLLQNHGGDAVEHSVRSARRRERREELELPGRSA